MNFYKKDKKNLKKKWRKDKRYKHFLKQYKKQGFTDADTYSLDHHLAQLIAPRLKLYKKFALQSVVPYWYLPEGYEDLPKKEHDKKMEKANKKYAKDFDLMIWTFEYIGSDRNFDFNDKDDKKIKKGLKLFFKMYCSLWW